MRDQWEVDQSRVWVLHNPQQKEEATNHRYRSSERTACWLAEYKWASAMKALIAGLIMLMHYSVPLPDIRLHGGKWLRVLPKNKEGPWCNSRGAFQSEWELPKRQGSSPPLKGKMVHPLKCRSQRCDGKCLNVTLWFLKRGYKPQSEQMQYLEWWLLWIL